MELGKILEINLVFCLSKRLLYLRRYVFWPFTYFNYRYIFHFSKFNFLWLTNLIMIRIRKDPHWFGFLDPDSYPHPHWDKRLDSDPDPHWNQCRSTSLVQGLQFEAHRNSGLEIVWSVRCLCDAFIFYCVCLLLSKEIFGQLYVDQRRKSFSLFNICLMIMTVEGFYFSVRKVVLKKKHFAFGICWFCWADGGGWFTGDCIVETLAATLPKLVSSLVLAVRGELVPLLLYTISKHKVRITRVQSRLWCGCVR